MSNKNSNRISADLKLKLFWGEVVSKNKHPMQHMKELLKFLGKTKLPIPIHQWLRNQLIHWKGAAR
ncbi:hypothetical protein ACX27_08730 [Nostoc piscinale CENA21]|uniref:Uncharacterized protein n=1 Tax=Nostoc piscinale CENA21 TaxID=224013 RepID=A0A0M4T188_9NOSO|nr:hypothetical protein ACX27_08730 [Nostoc piscinale CENA21]